MKFVPTIATTSAPLPCLRMAALTRGTSCADDHSKQRRNRQSNAGKNRRVVEISTSGLVSRHSMAGRGILAELVQTTSDDRIEYRHRGSSQLLVAYEGARSEGETIVQGATRSRLRDFAQKLSFVPADHDYFDWQRPRTPTRLLYLNIDATAFEGQLSHASWHMLSAPRLFFGNPMLWGTVVKLRGLLETPESANPAYFA